MTAIATAPAAADYVTPLDNPEFGQEVTLLRGDHKGKNGIIAGEYNGRSYPVEITVGGARRVVNASPASIGPRDTEEPSLEIDLSTVEEETAEVEPAAEAPVEEKTAKPKRARIQRIEFDADEVVQPAEIEKGEHEFQDEAKGIYPTPRHLGRGYIYRYNLGWRWHNTHDEAPSLEDKGETFLIGYYDRLNRMKKWHGTWFGNDEVEGDDA